MAEQPGREINALVGAAVPEWQAQYGLYEDKAPGHAIISQIIALVGDNPDQIVHIEAQIEASQPLSNFDMQLMIFTKSLLLDIRVDPGESPTTRVVPRSSLKSLRMLSSPIVTFRQTGSDWQPTILELVYPEMDVSLPFDQYRRASSDSVALLLPSLIEDLNASGS
jgi:hypothetical protein